MDVDFACDLMRDFGRFCKRRGYIVGDSDLFAGLGAYKAYGGEGLGNEELQEAFLIAKEFVMRKAFDEYMEGA